MAAVLCFFIGEWATATTRQMELQKERQARNVTTRTNFVFRAASGWVYTIRQLNTTDNDAAGRARAAVRNDTMPTYAVTADSARWSPKTMSWAFLGGASIQMLPDDEALTLRFKELRLPAITGRAPRSSDRAEEPGRDDVRRAGAIHRNAEKLRERHQEARGPARREAGASRRVPDHRPLRGSARGVGLRAGPAVGIAISLGTTIVYLLMINLSQAVGASGVINPTLAAWVPNLVFLD